MRSALLSAHTRLLKLTAAAIFLGIAGAASAQDLPGAASGASMSRVDFAGAYGYIRPFSSDIHSIPYNPVLGGGVFSGAFYFKTHLGIQLEGTYSPRANNDNDCYFTAQAGPIVRVRKGRFVPFLHALGGAAEVGGPALQTCSTWGWGVTGGGGVDYILPVFRDHLAARVVQADFNYSHIQNPNPPTPIPQLGGLGEIYDVHLSGGLVLRLGGAAPAGGGDTTLTCSADPGNPMPGDPVTLTASVLNLKSDRDVRYLWETSAGHIAVDPASNGATAVVDTHGLAAGTYNVTGRLVRGSKQKPVAMCTTSFTVVIPQPPTLTCSADRAAINSGDPVTITAQGNSPQNLPLTYSYTSTNGMVTGNGPIATLSTIGATPGTITVTCKVIDDRGQSATANVSVVVATPVTRETPRAQTQSLCGISFDRDRKRPDRVDNEAKACLDDIALTLQRQPDAKLLIIGNYAPAEQNRNAAERAMNAAQYLTDEKGIEPTRLDLRIGSAGNRSVATMLIPIGATIDPATAASFDRSSVKRTGQAYGKPRTSAPAPRRTPRHHSKPKRIIARPSQF